MRKLLDVLRKAAASEATVLIEGETGTGKDLSARTIHENSARHAGPFVVVDCGSIPPTLLQSELFGYERGAFTGAISARMGAFEASNGGTVFLDEVGELSLDLQPQILRVLEDRQIKRIGSNKYTPVDIRVVAATNRSLAKAVASERFRSDLYYRLAVLRVKVPSLRERKADLPLLVQEVLAQLGAAGTPLAGELCTEQFMSVLARHDWPGNVRQLRNYLQSQIALGGVPSPPGNQISLLPPRDARMDPPTVAVDQPLKRARQEWNRVFEIRYVEALLQRHGGNVTEAARAAGVNRVYFYRLLWKHGLRGQDLVSWSDGTPAGARVPRETEQADAPTRKEPLYE
jgi:two-component system response regulator GlrR